MTDLERIQETLDILSSSMTSGFAQIHERLEGLDQRLERVEQRFDGVDQRLDGIDQRLDGIDQRLEGIDQRLDGIDQRLDGIDQRLDGHDKRLDGVDQRLDRIDDRLDNIEANMATKMELARMRMSLEQGQGLLLKVVRGHTDQLGALLPAVSELGRRVGTLETTVKESAGAH